MKKSQKIVFFGNEKLATGINGVEPVILNSLRRAGYVIEQVVVGPINELQPHESRLAVLAAYGHIIPQSVLDQFPLGIINIHPSLLPKYRGSTPIEQAILDGETKTGVSIMQLSFKMDEGPLYAQRTVQLSGKETKGELTAKLHELGAEMLIEVLPAIFSGDLQPRQQPHPDRATYTRRLTKQDGSIEWNKSAEEIVREIRAYSGWPKSSCTLFGIDMSILEAGVSDGWGSSVGTVSVDLGTKKIRVQCNQSSLEIITLQPAGKKPMDVVAFLNGYKSTVLSSEGTEIY